MFLSYFTVWKNKIANIDLNIKNKAVFGMYIILIT